MIDSAVQSMGDMAVQSAMLSAKYEGVRANKNASESAIDKSAKDFEAMFISQMLQPMWEGVEVNSMFGGGHGEEVMRGILVQEYGKSVVNTGGFGLSDAIKSEMIKIQQGADRKNGANATAVAVN